MDPDACLDMIHDSAYYDAQDRAWSCQDLIDWLRKGGYIPAGLGGDRAAAIAAVVAMRDELRRAIPAA